MGKQTELFKVIELDHWRPVDATPEDFEDPLRFTVIEAGDEEEAAELYCSETDCSSAEYAIIGRGCATVMVQNEDGEISKYDIHAYADPVYHARKAKA